MTKPQFAAEPSMEDILASIRRMISDDKPVSNPLPDQMARTPFETLQGPRGVSPAAAPTPSGSNFSSLSDALKAATATTDQRRLLQQEIAEVLEKGQPVPRADLATFEPAKRESRTSGGAPSEPHFPSLSQRAADLTAGPAAQRGSPALDFGTVVPQRDSTASRAEPTSLSTARATEPAPEPETPTVVALPSRGQLNGAGLNSSTVAPFTRPVREAAKSPEPVAVEEVKPAAPDDASTRAPSADVGPAASAPQNAAQEALLDAVVDMVQKQPESLSVFTSGASFISGVVGKPKVSDNSRPADAAAGAAGPAPKMDKAAAELLRPMLRQWLSDNMPRIVEEALRSELMSSQSGDGKGSKG